VEEVGGPFVEDESDEVAKQLRSAQTATALKLAALIDQRQNKLAANSKAMQMLDVAKAMAHNSRGNARATDRLLGRDIAFAAGRYAPQSAGQRRSPTAGKCRSGRPGPLRDRPGERWTRRRLAGPAES
jgi:hypothetical protein